MKCLKYPYFKNIKSLNKTKKKTNLSEKKNISDFSLPPFPLSLPPSLDLWHLFTDLNSCFHFLKIVKMIKPKD